MKKQLVLIHATGFVSNLLRPLITDQLPGLDCVHIVDEGILRETVKHGGQSPVVYRRVAAQALLAADLQPDMILFTCSATSPTIDVICTMVPMPILKIDEPMAEAAVSMGRSIGFIATAKGSLGPGVELLKAKAAATRKDISITPVLLEPAFAALQAGNSAEHDRLVGEKARELAADHSVVVLGQASMAHLADPLRKAIGKPVLGSVPFCMEALKKLEVRR